MESELSLQYYFLRLLADTHGMLHTCVHMGMYVSMSVCIYIRVDLQVTRVDSG